MTDRELFNLAIEMVVTYYNEHKAQKKKDRISKDNVCITTFTDDHEGMIGVSLAVSGEDDTEYNVVYNPNADSKEHEIVSYIVGKK